MLVQLHFTPLVPGSGNGRRGAGGGEVSRRLVSGGGFVTWHDYRCRDLCLSDISVSAGQASFSDVDDPEVTPAGCYVRI